MNRLRAAYAELDPGILPFFLTSPFDDLPGSKQTYLMLGRRSGPGHFAGSSMMLIATVTAALVGLFVAGVAASLTVSSTVALIVGLVGGTIYLAVVLIMVYRRLGVVWRAYQPRFPSPEP
jgi:hypothetical protein